MRFINPRKYIITKKYPFAVLHDVNGNELEIEWPQVKGFLEEGRIVASPCVLGGYFYYRLNKGELYSYNQYLGKWVKENINKYDQIYKQELAYDVINKKIWLVTNIEDIIGFKMIFPQHQ